MAVEDVTEVKNKQFSSEVFINETMLDENALTSLKSENLPLNTHKCDEILPDIKLEIDEISSRIDYTPSLANVEKTPSQNSEILSHLCSQESSSSMIEDSNNAESIQFDGVEINSFLNVDDLGTGNSSILDEDALLNEDSSPITDNAAINEISSQMDDENALLNKDEMDDGNAEQINEDALLNDEESSLNDSSSQKFNEVLSENDEDKLLSEGSYSQRDRKCTELDENLLEMDEDTLLSEGSQLITSPQVNENIESSQNSSQIDENIESSQISSQIDKSIESSETSLLELNAAPSPDDESLLKGDHMLYIPVPETLQPITELLKDDGMLYIPEAELFQPIDENSEEKKPQLGSSKLLDILSTPIKYVNECIEGESMDSRESSEEGEIVTGDSLIVSGESRFLEEPEIKQEHIEDCEQLTINEQANFDDCEGKMNNEDMLDMGQKCNEVDGLFIKEECLERIEGESQDCHNIDMEESTILPQIAICESLQTKQDNELTSLTHTETVIKEECVEFDGIETLDLQEGITDIKVKEECIDIFDESLVKQEVGYFDDVLHHKEEHLNLNIVNDTDLSVVPVSLKSNSEFHNGNLPNSMEEEIIIPSSVTTNLRPRRCRKFRSKESDAISENFDSEPHLRDMDEEVDDLLAPRGFACPICNKKYMNIVTLTRHEKTHEEIELNDPKSIVVKDGIYKCSCGKGFRRRSSALACIKVHRKTGLPCQWCELIFQTQMTLRKHCKEAHRDMMQAKHTCTTCKKTFTHKRGLLRHTQSHLRYLKKEMKTKKIKPRPKDIEVIELDSEDSLEKPQLSCDFCDIDYKSVADLRSHLICAHPVIHSASELDLAKKKPFSKFKFICRTCGRGHSTLGALTLHNKTEHKKVKVTNSSISNCIIFCSSCSFDLF